MLWSSVCGKGADVAVVLILQVIEFLVVFFMALVWFSIAVSTVGMPASVEASNYACNQIGL